MIYEKLTGGYLAPAYEILPSEAWVGDARSAGTALIGTSPKFQGSHSLGVSAPGPGITVVTSDMDYDLSTYDGIALPTFASSGTPLVLVGVRLLTQTADVTVAQVVGVTTDTLDGYDCLVLDLPGVSVDDLNVVSGESEAVLTGTNLDRTFLVQDAVEGATPADSLLYVRAVNLVPSGSYNGTVYVYGAGAEYFKTTVPVTSGAASAYAYEIATYNLSPYGFNTPIALDAWNVQQVPIPSDDHLPEELQAVGDPTWGRIVAVHLACFFDDAGTFYLDGIGGWARATAPEATANQYVSSLPTYHHDQEFTDVFAQAIGVELDALRATVGVGLEERLVSRATYDLNLHEDAMGVAPYPLLRSIARRRSELVGYLSMPASLTETEAALNTIMGGATPLQSTFDGWVNAGYPTTFDIAVLNDLAVGEHVRIEGPTLGPYALGIVTDINGIDVTIQITSTSPSDFGTAEWTITRIDMLGPVTLTVDHDALTVDVFLATADPAEQARLRRACTRLLPAHLGTSFHFDDVTVVSGARETTTLGITQIIT